MNTSSDEPRDDLLELGDRLRAARPQLTAAELDDVKLRVRRRVARPESKGTGFMKSRLAIMLMLVLGVMLSTTGAGLAISGVAGSDDAAGNQYCAPDSSSGYTGPGNSGTTTNGCDHTHKTKCADKSASGNSGNGSGNSSGEKCHKPDNGVLGVQKGGGGKGDTSTPTTPVDTAAPQQVATSGSGQLAFTGYAGLLVLVLGLGLLTTGVILRRRTRTE
jgi:hypothetical protein